MRKKHFIMSIITVMLSIQLICLATGCAQLRIQEDAMLQVFFEEDINDERKQEIMDFIAEQEIVYDVQYVSAEEAWNNFSEAYEIYEELEDALGENPLVNSDSCEVYIQGTKKNINKIVNDIESMAGVRKVNLSVSNG